MEERAKDWCPSPPDTPAHSSSPPPYGGGGGGDHPDASKAQVDAKLQTILASIPSPPTLPRHLEKVILNTLPKDVVYPASTGGGASKDTNDAHHGLTPQQAAAGGGGGGGTGAGAGGTGQPNMTSEGNAGDDNSILPVPNHVVLNHLTASAIKNGTLAVGTTTRYRKKYISTVLIRPVGGVF